MTATPHATFEAQLIRQRTALLEQITQQRGGDIGRAEAAADHFAHTEDSQAQVATARAIEFALGEHEIVELGAIEAALKRIADGSYGLCAECGVAIADARLHAAPEALRCIACQTATEAHL